MIIDSISVWSNIIIPLCIVPIGVFFKSIWDRYTNLKIEKSQSIKRHMVEITQHKLENFYWPIYIRLLKINEIESKIKIQNTYHCKKRQQIKNENTNIHDVCIEINNNNDNDIHVNDTDNLYSSDLSSTEEEYTTSDDEEHNWDKMYKIINIEKKSDKKIMNRNSTKRFIGSIFENNENNSVQNSILKYIQYSPKNKLKNEETDMSDFHENEEEQIERRIHKKNKQYLDVDVNIVNEILQSIFVIYCELEEIIIKNIHIAEVNKKLKKELLKFLKFITMLRVLRENKQNLTPLDFGAKYPKLLLELIEKNVTSLQKLYNTIIYN